MHAAIVLAKQAAELIHEQDFNLAIQRLAQSQAISPGPLAAYGTAFCYFCMKNYSKAISICQTHVNSSKDFEDRFKVILARALEALGDYSSAFETWKSLLESSQSQELQDYSLKKIARLHLILKNCEEFNSIQQKNNEKGETVFLISSEWVSKWKNFIFNEGQHPGPISNIHLISSITQDPRDYASIVLNPELTYQDFQIFSTSSYKALKALYSSDHDIKRFSINFPLYSELELHLSSISILFCPKVSQQLIETFEFRYSSQETIQEMVSSCKSMVEASFDHVSYNFDVYRIWKVPKETVIPSDSEKIFLQSAELVTKFNPSHKPEVFLFEFQKIDANWSIYNQLESPCPNCLQVSELVFTCAKCKTIQYCSKDCADKHNFVHVNDCCNLIERNGKTGLGNLGNTCYMNSVIQCLSHTEILKNYFISKMYLIENPVNGLITQTFARLVVSLWGVNSGVIFPSELKRNFSRKFKSFEGLNQHDAHEFLIHLLDCINEEMKTKAGEVNVVSRNFYGLSENILTCIECGSKSYKEEEFLTLPLQVLNLDRVQITVYVFSSDLNKAWRRVVNCYYSWSTRELIKLVQEETGFDVLLCFYDMLEFRGQVRDVELGEYLGKVLVAFEVRGKTPVLCCFRGGLGKVMIDQVIFVDFDNEEEFLQRVNEKVRGLIGKIGKSLEDVERVSIVDQEKTSGLETNFGKLLKVVVDVRGSAADFYKTIQDIDVLNVNPPADYSIYNGISVMNEIEHLNNENKCYCDNCAKKTQMTRKFSIKKFPKILIFQLLKFKNSLTKLNTFVDFPVCNLDLERYGCDSLYELYATCNHYGSYSFGHYTASVRSEDTWYEFSDSFFSSINEGQVVSQSAYLLFYVRR